MPFSRAADNQFIKNGLRSSGVADKHHRCATSSTRKRWVIGQCAPGARGSTMDISDVRNRKGGYHWSAA
jgi:hypothetical protein